jgi:hypothetical protein
MAVAVLVFGVAFGYVEAAVVVYLRAALGPAPEPLFPLQQVAAETGRMIGIEAGREVATLVMLAAIGFVAGRSPLERLAWSAVAFGAWDLAYYGWLWVFIGWPTSLGDLDLLFLLPVPWVGPVWAPMTVSLALVGFGLLAARRFARGGTVHLARWHVVAGLGAGLLVVLSFMLDTDAILAGGQPGDFAWPVFLAGILLAVVAAFDALRSHPSGSTGRSAPPDADA